jgi:hypothetical protein
MRLIRLITIALLFFSCSNGNTNKIDGRITEIWIQPFGVYGGTAIINVFFVSEDSVLYQKVVSNEVDKIELYGLDGYDNELDIIYKSEIDTIGRRNRYYISIHTDIKVVEQVLCRNDTINKIQGLNSLYEIPVKEVGVHIESKDLQWNFGVLKQNE